jgi:hypothetical protein
MITLKRLHLVSPLSAGELRAKLEAAIGRSELYALDSSWSGDIDTPFAGKVEGQSFKARRRGPGGQTMIEGSIYQNVLDVEIGMPVVSIVPMLFIPIAIVFFFVVRYDMAQIEATFRELANAPR